MNALKAYYSRIAVLDLRSVAAFRLVLGLVVFFNILFCRWLVAPQYYYPENSLFPIDWHEGQFHFWGQSIFSLLGSPVAVQVFMALSAIVALLYAAGFRTRITAPLLWFCWWNLNQRNPLLMAGWDTYIDCLLFCSIFLPLDGRFTLFRRKKSPLNDAHLSPAVLLILTQVAVIYAVNGLTKNGHTWISGTAVQIISGDAVLSTGHAISFGLSRALSWLTLVFEIGLPLLLFIPWRRRQLRIAAAIIILLFHWGISFYVDVGWFKWASLSVVVLLLPGEVWNRLLKEKKSGENRLSRWEVWAPVLPLILLLLMSLRTIAGFSNHPAGRRSTSATVWALLPPKIDNASWLNQEWKLYSPDPPRSDGFLYLTGITTDGVAVTVAPLSNPRQDFDRDPVMRFYAAGMRFRMADKVYSPVFTPWLTYELRRWNKMHKPRQLAKMTMTYHAPGKEEKVAEIAVEY